MSEEPTTRERPRSTVVRRRILNRLAGAFLVAAGVATFGLLFSVIIAAWHTPESTAAIPPVNPSAAATPTRNLPPMTPTPTPVLPVVALVAGHAGGIDTGALCPDGLREVDVTIDVTTKAKTILQARGYRVDILGEFDSRLSSTLRDYAPQAFLAVHADSCIYTATGFKVARASNSASPAEDDRLVRCVTADYGAITELPFHADSITADMTRYHAFNEIDPKSPSAILELGFLGSEHDLLKNQRGKLAEGIANGIDDFMRGNQCKKVEGAK